MGQRRVGRDHQVKVLDHRGGVHEVVEPAAQVNHGKAARELFELLGARTLLKTEEFQAGNTRQRLEAGEPERAMAVLLVVRIALPGDADLETVEPA